MLEELRENSAEWVVVCLRKFQAGCESWAGYVEIIRVSSDDSVVQRGDVKGQWRIVKQGYESLK